MGILEEELEKIERALLDKGRNLIAHQLNSFNHFLGKEIERLIHERLRDVEVLPSYSAANTHAKQSAKQKQANMSSSEQPRPGWRRAKLNVRSVHITKPEWVSEDGQSRPLFPHEARLQKLTYSAELKADIHIKVFKPSDMGLSGKGKGKQSNISLEIGKGKSACLVTEDVEQEELVQGVSMGRIPVMVQSDFCQMNGLSKEELLRKGHCQFDVGGYFIIKGSEKVLIAQEEKARGLRYGSLKEDKGFSVRMPIANRGLALRSSNVIVRLKYGVAKEKKEKSKAYKRKVPCITVQIPFCKEEVNAIILLRALGITNDEQLFHVVGVDPSDTQRIELILPSLEAAHEEMCPLLYDQPSNDSSLIRVAALNVIGNRLKSKMDESPSITLERCLFPDLFGKDRIKAMYVGHMVGEVLACCLGTRHEDNAQCLSAKRLELAGDLLMKQLKIGLLRFSKELQKRLQLLLVKEGTIDLQKQVSSFCFDKAFLFEKAFATGNWARPQDKSTIKTAGMVVPLDRENPLATVSHLRQTEMQVDLRAKLHEARYPNMSYIGRLCLVQSPDNEKVGLVKSLALSSHVTLGSPEDDTLKALKQLTVINLEDVPLHGLKDMAKVFLNGQWMGVHENARNLAMSLRLMRRTSKTHFEVEIVEDIPQKVVRVFCDAGRILRPLIIIRERSSHSAMEIAQKLGSCRDWTVAKLLQAGIIEFVGPAEEANCLVASKLADIVGGSTKQFTHCEIHPALMFGLNASLIPFANHNHMSRVMHQSQKHCKQAIGHYTTRLAARQDTSGQSLMYPQRPLVTTRFMRVLGRDDFADRTTRFTPVLCRDEFANGQNAIVAVCPFLGYNQEDSIVMNQSSIDRGLFNSFHYRRFTNVFDQREESLMKPAEGDNRKGNRPYGAYKKLDNDGLPQLDENFLPRDVIIGKVSAHQTNALFQDRSIELKTWEQGRVDRVTLASDATGQTIVSVCLRQRRAPIVGDKFSSTHGQKGVLGLVVPQYDLPFTKQGITPDIMINPHAFPSRQTLGQLMESEFSKASAIKGAYFDGTAFTHDSLQVIRKELHQLGYQQWGEESLIHGHTGERIQAGIFIGPAFYQRLTKMAEDQIKYRRQGPTHPLTHQPVTDRKRYGGVRIGEMERDCLLGHGVSANIQERLFILSDQYKVHVCQGCNTLTSKDTNKHTRTCRFCRTSKHIVCVDVPYSCKLLYQELLSMGVFMRLKTELD